MLKRILIMSLATAAFSAIACIVYNRVYSMSLGPDFSKVLNMGSIIGVNIFASLLAGVGYWISQKMFGTKAEVIFKIVFALTSFISILGPFAISLPLDVQSPELFPGLTVPMHFFPLVGWFTLEPLFLKKALS